MASMKQVIILRKDLNMRKGKMVAQGAHASMAAILYKGKLLQESRVENWLANSFTKICVSVNSEYELLELFSKARDNGLICSLIQDNGLTEFNGVPTYTAVAIGPDKVEVIDQYTKHLPLL